MQTTTLSPSSSTVQNSASVIAGGIVAALLFFWPQFTSGFARLYGDAYDGTIEAVLVSHWYGVFRGLQHWNNPPYFYPRVDVLGYNDGYFLYGVIAAAFRALGADVFRAMEYMHVVVRLIGYFSMYALLQRMADRRVINIAVAVVFTLSVNTLNGTHLQLLAVSFAPLMALLGLACLDALQDGRRGRFRALSVGWAALYGMWLITGFYMAFFFGLFLIVFALSYAVVDRDSFHRYTRLLAVNWKQLAVFLVAFMLACVPFLRIYLPKLGETGGQTISAALAFAQSPMDLLNSGSYSMLWGSLWHSVRVAAPNLLGDGEHVTGYTPLFLFMCLVGSVAAFRAKERVLMTLAVTSAVLALLVMSVDGHSLWTVAYYLIPGARGVRVIARMFIFLSFPMSILIASALHREQASRTLLVVTLAFLMAEQVNLSPDMKIDVAQQLSALDRVSAPPTECKAFYGIHNTPFQSWSEGAMAMYVNIQSMLIADQVNLPTINGVATFIPPESRFRSDDEWAYLKQVRDFAAANGVVPLCEYDIATGKWSRVN